MSKICPFDTDNDGDCPIHPRGCAQALTPPKPGCPVCLGTGATCENCGAAEGHCTETCLADRKVYGRPGLERCTYCGGQG